MKEFFDRMDVFLAKCDPLVCFLGVILMGALIYYKLEQKRLATGHWGEMKAIFLIVYISCSVYGGVYIFSPWAELSLLIGAAIGLFLAVVLSATADTIASIPYEKEWRKKWMPRF